MSNISPREKGLLIILIMGVIIFITYMFVYKPIIEKVADLKNRVSELDNKVKEAENKEVYIKEFNAKKQELELKEIEFAKKFPEDFSLIDGIVLMRRLNSLQPEIRFISLDFDKKPENSENQNIDNQSNSSNSSNSNVKRLDLTFTAKYSSVRKLLENIVDKIEPKVVVTGINIVGKENILNNQNDSKSDNKNVNPDLQVTLNLEVITYKPAAKLNEKLKVNEYKSQGEKGKENIFMPFKGMGKTPFVVEDYKNLIKNPKIENGVVDPGEDFYVGLRPVKMDGPAVELGRTGASTEAIFDDDGGITNIRFEFIKKDKKYYFRYSTDKMKYPIDGSFKEFKPRYGQKIILGIFGKQITETNDNIGANVYITNKTDIPVVVTVRGDRPNNSCIKVNKVYGEIIEYRN